MSQAMDLQQALQNLTQVINASVKAGIFAETQSVVNLHNSFAFLKKFIEDQQAEIKDSNIVIQELLHKIDVLEKKPVKLNG